MKTIILKRLSVVGILILSTLISSCETSSSALELENTPKVKETTITTTATPTDTTIETTNELNYQTNLTVCSMYTPTSETTPPFDDTSESSTTEVATVTTITDITSTTEPECTTSTEVTTSRWHYHESSVTTTTTPLVDSSYFLQDCAFIGDSLTVGLSMYGLISKDYTFAEEGISISGMNSLQLYTNYGYVYPAQAISYWQPKHVYIMLGINGVSWISNDKAIESYRQLIESILSYNVDSIEDINIISVLPVAHSKEVIGTVEDGRILNSEIDALNLRLKDMATSYNLHYVDANSVLKDASTGCLPDDLTVDGIHLTESGYEALIQALVDDLNR